MDKHIVIEVNAKLIYTWIKTRGGLAIWKSINLSNPGASWTTPLLTEEGQPTPRPTWQAESAPSRIIKSVDEVLVSIPKEVKRFHVAIRLGSQGLTYKLTDGSTRRLEQAVSKATEEHHKTAFYKFDYETQEAVIYIDDVLIPLVEYAKAKGLEV